MTTDAVSTDVGTLTRQDILALRTATAITFHRNDWHTVGASTHVLRAHLSDYQRVVATSAEQRYFPDTDQASYLDRRRNVPVQGSVISFARYVQDTEKPTCFHMIHNSRYDAVWQTVVACLRIGDTLVLRWRADNNSDTIREANLHADELHLEVQRNGQPALTFRVATSICPDNTARMIRF